MKKSHKITIPTALMLILLAVVATFNITFFAATEYYNSQLDQLNQLESRYSKLKSVADIVQKYFVADYDEADAIEGALAGYIDGLGDQWSAYYNKEQTARLAEDDANVYVGIGVTFSTDPASLYTITAVTAGGPAAQAGLLAGDVIRAADGVDVDTLASSEDLIALVKGEKVSFSGFGIFESKLRKARVGRDPHTKEPMQIPETNVPTFKPSKVLKDTVAKESL